MAAVTSDFVRALTVGVISIYAEAYAAAPAFYKDISTVIPSTQQTENYSWIADIPVMREWIDERQIRALKDFGFSITNKKWEATMGISRQVIEDDQTGQITPRIMSLAEAANAHYDRLLADLINSNPTAFDGVAMYHATHNNLATGGGSVLSATSLAAGYTAMRKQTSPVEGEPMDVRPTHLLVPPDLEIAAQVILNSMYTPDASGSSFAIGANNPIPRLGLSLVVSNRLATTTEWHLFDCSHAVKPWIIAQRIAPVMSSPNANMFAEGGESESAFMRDELLFGVRSRDNAGPGLPQYAYKSAGA